ncbi:MAG TPA: ABC transporter permease [Anaerolineae bacterium]|nr:ABC transporter permease [Anaerolineae bacterium]HQI86810.1 ABC transporter permease [Anaerolineae bacterium]
MSIQRVSAIIKKETIQMIRDWPTLLMIILMPVLELFLFAYVGDMTLDHLPTVVADMSRDPSSRAFINALEVSGFFDVTQYVSSEGEVIRAIDEGVANVGLVIPPDFAGQIERGVGQALIIIDGSDSFVVQSGYSAAVAIAQVHGMRLMLQTAARMGMAGAGQLPINTSTRILYNPNIDEIVFLIPGLAAMLLQLIGVNTTVMAVVRERELGTMEQMLVTPTRPVELILGKIVPPIGLITVDLVIIILLGVYWFKVPFQGSVWLFSWLSLLFIVSGLGMGLLLSTVSKNQKQAQQISSVVMMLTMLLTGLIYPRSTMPPVVRLVGNLIPATYFIRIARGIITKGVGLTFMWDDVIALVVYGVVIVILSAATFKTRLD